MANTQIGNNECEFLKGENSDVLMQVTTERNDHNDRVNGFKFVFDRHRTKDMSGCGSY